MGSITKLTKKAIENMSPEKDWDIRWDSELSGFGIRFYSGGKKSFILSYRVIGQKKLMIIGRYGAPTLDE